MSDLFFTTLEAAQVAGVPSTRLLYIASSFMEPTVQGSGRGSSRFWTVSDIMAARCGVEWKQAGVDLGTVAKMMCAIRERSIDELRARPVLMLCDGECQFFAESEKFTVPDGQALAVNLRGGLAFLIIQAKRVAMRRGARKRNADKLPAASPPEEIAV